MKKKPKDKIIEAYDDLVVEGGKLVPDPERLEKSKARLIELGLLEAEEPKAE